MNIEYPISNAKMVRSAPMGLRASTFKIGCATSILCKEITFTPDDRDRSNGLQTGVSEELCSSATRMCPIEVRVAELRSSSEGRHDA